MPTVCRGFSDEYGSWKIIWISRRIGAQLPATDRCVMSRPSNDDLAAGRLQQPGHQAAGGGLAAAGLADHAQRLAGAHVRSRCRRPRGRRRPVRWKTTPRLIGKCFWSPETSRRFSGSSSGRRGAGLVQGLLVVTHAGSSTPGATAAAGSARSKICFWSAGGRWHAAGRGRRRSSSGTLGRARDAVVTGRERAPGVERAAGRQVDQARRRARDRHAAARAPTVDSRGIEPSRPHAYGCSGRLEDRPAPRRAPCTAGVHHQDVVGEVGDHAQVVRDQDDRGAGLLLEVLEQVEDLRLHGHVERGGRLVRDQQLRVADQRHRDHRALPHTAGELVRVVVHPGLRLRDADPAEHLDRPLAGLRLARPRCASCRPRRSARRPCSTGAARSAGPGRPSPSSCRAARARRSRGAGQFLRRRARSRRMMVVLPRVVQAQDGQVGDRLAGARTRRRCRASCPGRDRRRARRRPSRCRPRSRTARTDRARRGTPWAGRRSSWGRRARACR